MSLEVYEFQRNCGRLESNCTKVPHLFTNSPALSPNGNLSASVAAVDDMGAMLPFFSHPHLGDPRFPGLKVPHLCLVSSIHGTPR